MENRALPAEGIHHVSFRVWDLDAAKNFYCRLLGFEELPRPVAPTPGAWLRKGNIELHAIVPPDGVDTGAALHGANAFCSHVAFRVRDYAETLRLLREAEIEVTEGTYGIRQMFVLDPGGNVIEFIAD